MDFATVIVFGKRIVAVEPRGCHPCSAKVGGLTLPTLNFACGQIKRSPSSFHIETQIVRDGGGCSAGVCDAF